MDIEIKTWLYDILNAITEIDSFFEDQPRELTAYKNDTRTRRAVERNIEIIGEATNRILRKDETIELSNSRKIVDTRNRILHGYDTVSDEIIWGVVIQFADSLNRSRTAFERVNTNGQQWHQAFGAGRWSNGQRFIC